LDETPVKSVRRAAARPRRGPTLLERSRVLITGQDLSFAGAKEDLGGDIFFADGANEEAVTMLRQAAEKATVVWLILGVPDVIQLCHSRQR
jgi:hypothetical protein